MTRLLHGWARYAHRLSIIAANLTSVDHQSSGPLANMNEEALLFQVADGHPGDRAIDLQPLAYHGWCDELCLRDFLQELVVGAFVEHYQVGKLLLDLALAPLLLLGLLGLLHNLVGTHGVRANLQGTRLATVYD